MEQREQFLNRFPKILHHCAFTKNTVTHDLGFCLPRYIHYDLEGSSSYTGLRLPWWLWQSLSTECCTTAMQEIAAISHSHPAAPWMYFWCLAVSPQCNFPTHAKLSVTPIEVPKQWWLVKSQQTVFCRTEKSTGKKKSLLHQSCFWDAHKVLSLLRVLLFSFSLIR